VGTFGLYNIDLIAMEQTSVSTGYKRPICQLLSEANAAVVSGYDAAKHRKFVQMRSVVEPFPLDPRVYAVPPPGGLVRQYQKGGILALAGCKPKRNKQRRQHTWGFCQIKWL
jgi:hypothetical protein